MQCSAQRKSISAKARPHASRWRWQLHRNQTIGKFAVSYADQAEKDWKRFLAAIGTGRIVVAEL
jgi:hypothetical protein